MGNQTEKDTSFEENNQPLNEERINQMNHADHGSKIDAIQYNIEHYTENVYYVENSSKTNNANEEAEGKAILFIILTIVAVGLYVQYKMLISIVVGTIGMMTLASEVYLLHKNIVPNKMIKMARINVCSILILLITIIVNNWTYMRQNIIEVIMNIIGKQVYIQTTAGQESLYSLIQMTGMLFTLAYFILLLIYNINMVSCYRLYLGDKNERWLRINRITSLKILNGEKVLTGLLIFSVAGFIFASGLFDLFMTGH